MRLSLWLCLSCLASQAYGVCGQAVLQHEHQDAATIQALETAWTVAYLRGDVDFERCLLTPDFTEILRDGSVKLLADELGLAAKNAGKDLTIPDLPEGSVLIHGGVAVAYGLSGSTDAGGVKHMTRYADYYVWEQGAWRAYFAQQSQFVQDPASR